MNFGIGNLNFFRLIKKNIFGSNEENNNCSHAIYMTDNLEHFKKVRTEHSDVHVEYHSDRTPSPIHFYVTKDGKTMGKENPEYIEYLKWQRPDITDDEISEIKRRAYEERIEAWEKSKQNEKGYEKIVK